MQQTYTENSCAVVNYSIIIVSIPGAEFVGMHGGQEHRRLFSRQETSVDLHCCCAVKKECTVYGSRAKLNLSFVMFLMFSLRSASSP